MLASQPANQPTCQPANQQLSQPGNLRPRQPANQIKIQPANLKSEMQTSMYQKLLVGVTLGSCTCTGKLAHGSRNQISCEVLGGVLREVLAGDLGRSWGSWGVLGARLVLCCIALCCVVW